MEATSGDAVDGQRFETRAIHAGQEPEALYGSVNVPIYQTATYAQDEVGRPPHRAGTDQLGWQHADPPGGL